MNEEPTHKLSNKRSFEEQVLARFDVFDARFDSIKARLENLESRSCDTKPIWERALAEIRATRSEMNARLGALETKLESIETRLGVVESHVACLRSDYASMRHGLFDTQLEFKRSLVESLVSFLTDTRNLMRDNNTRLKQLESKLA